MNAVPAQVNDGLAPARMMTARISPRVSAAPTSPPSTPGRDSPPRLHQSVPVHLAPPVRSTRRDPSRSTNCSKAGPPPGSGRRAPAPRAAASVAAMGLFATMAYSDGRWTRGRPTAVPFLLVDVHDSDLATVDYRFADASGGRFHLGYEPRIYFEQPDAALPMDADAEAAGFARWVRDAVDADSIPTTSGGRWPTRRSAATPGRRRRRDRRPPGRAGGAAARRVAHRRRRPRGLTTGISVRACGGPVPSSDRPSACVRSPTPCGRRIAHSDSSQAEAKTTLAVTSVGQCMPR